MTYIEASDILIWDVIQSGLVVLTRVPIEQEGENVLPLQLNSKKHKEEFTEMLKLNIHNIVHYLHLSLIEFFLVWQPKKYGLDY